MAYDDPITEGLKSEIASLETALRMLHEDYDALVERYDKLAERCDKLTDQRDALTLERNKYRWQLREAEKCRDQYRDGLQYIAEGLPGQDQWKRDEPASYSLAAMQTLSGTLDKVFGDK